MPGSTPAAPAANTRYLSSPAGATLHGKTQGFLPRLSPQNKAHVHPCSHYDAFCNVKFPTRISRRTWQHKTTTTMQPSHWDLQPESQETRRTAHAWTTTHCRTQRRDWFAPGSTPAAPAAHMRYLSSPARATLHGKTQGFPARRFPKRKRNHYNAFLQLKVPNPHLSTHVATQNDNDHAAIALRSAVRESRNTQNYARMNNHSLQNTEEELIRARYDRSRTRRTHEVPFTAGTEKRKVSCCGFPQNETHVTCSHYNAFGNSKFPTRISRRTWQHKTTMIMQPLHCDLQPEPKGGTDWCPVRPQLHPPQTRGIFHRRPEPLYTEKYNASCPAFPQNVAHVHPCSHYNAFCNLKFPTRISRRAWQQKTTTIIQPL